MSSGIGCTGSTYPPRRATSAAGAGLPHGEPAGWTWLHGPRADSSVVVSPGEPVPRPGTMATDVAWAHGRSSRRQGYCSVRRALVSQVVARVEGGTGGCLRGARGPGLGAAAPLTVAQWHQGRRVLWRVRRLEAEALRPRTSRPGDVRRSAVLDGLRANRQRRWRVRGSNGCAAKSGNAYQSAHRVQDFGSPKNPEMDDGRCLVIGSQNRMLADWICAGVEP